MKPRTRRWPVAAAVVVASLTAGCHAGGSAPAAVSSAGAPVPAAVPAASSPIAVTVAPAVVAPGAVHSGTPLPTVVVPTPARVTAPSPATYVVPCVAYPAPKQILPQVSPGSGTATVGWRSDGDTTVTTYRVTAVSQQLVAGSQPAPPTATVARGAGCGSLSVTITGLSHQVSYVFWLEEGRVDAATGALRYTMVGQSGAVLVP